MLTVFGLLRAAGGLSTAASRVAILAVAAPEAPSQAAAVAEAPRELHGFELVRDEFVHEYDSHVRMYRHQRTGETSRKGPLTRRLVHEAVIRVLLCDSTDA